LSLFEFNFPLLGPCSIVVDFDVDTPWLASGSFILRRPIFSPTGSSAAEAVIYDAMDILFDRLVSEKTHCSNGIVARQELQVNSA
jgi:hypothetical protein